MSAFTLTPTTRRDMGSEVKWTVGTVTDGQRELADEGFAIIGQGTPDSCEVVFDGPNGAALAKRTAEVCNMHHDLVDALRLLRGVRMLDNLSGEQVASIDAAISKATGATP